MMRWFWFLSFLFVNGITTVFCFGLPLSEKQLSDTVFNKVYEPGLRSVQLNIAEKDFSDPVISLGGDQKLELRFDDLSATRRNLGYTLVHCSAEWIPSDSDPIEYLSGTGRGLIREVSSSFNTTYDYTHYRLLFPEEDGIPLVSGNYAIKVYDEENPDKIILSRRFYITEETARIEASVKQPGFGEARETSHQVSFRVWHNNEIRDPVRELTAVVFQNNRSDRRLILGKPYTVQTGMVSYDDPETGIIAGGNEFRSLDIKNTRYQTQNLSAITFQNPYYHAFMKPDEERGSKAYFSHTDLNGNYYIDREKSDDRHTESDYIYVHFNLSAPLLYTDDKVYVTGDFIDWQHDESNQMIFNESTGNYELIMLMKQGLYDYCFYKSGGGSEKANELELEGSFYETENDYGIFIYFHDQYKGYDRLVGHLSIK